MIGLLIVAVVLLSIGAFVSYRYSKKLHSLQGSLTALGEEHDSLVKKHALLRSNFEDSSFDLAKNIDLQQKQFEKFVEAVNKAPVTAPRTICHVCGRHVKGYEIIDGLIVCNNDKENFRRTHGQSETPTLRSN